MIALTFRRLSFLFVLPVLAVLALGCTTETDSEPTAAPAPDPTKKPAKARKVEIGKGVYLEIEGTAPNEERRVLVSASICLTKGALELLMTRKDTKEHEAVLTADIDGRKLKEALLLTGAKEGSPVRFDPKFQPAFGQALKITAEYENEKKQVVSINTREWVRNSNTKKPLQHDWVFAGSRLVPNPLDPKKTIFLANDGDLVCVSNFEDALLDLPIRSSKDAADLVWEANTEKIPPVGTKVTVIFEPIPARKK